MGQKGFAAITLILLIILILFGSALIYWLRYGQNLLSPISSRLTQSTNPAPLKNYTNSDFNLSFSYPQKLTAQTDTEEGYSKRNGGDARKNFTGYVGYSPEKVLFAVSVLGKDLSFENSVFTIWVFDNPNQLTSEKWFNEFWYYPFLWGQFNQPDKQPLAPKNEATISGQIAKYGKVDYQPGSPKYFYINKNSKMYLIKVLTTNQTGDQILSTFKFSL